MIEKYMNTYYNKYDTLPWKWHEVTVGRIVASELVWTHGRRVIWNQKRVVSPEVDGCGSQHVRWTEVAGRYLRCVSVCVLRIPKGLHPAECSFLPFLTDKIRISKYKTCIMFTLFPDISMTLEQICIFKTSVIAEMSLYKFQAVFILQSIPWIRYADRCTHVCIHNIEDEKMRRIQWIMSFLYTSIVKLFMVEYFYVVLHFSTTPKKNTSFKKFQISEKKIVLTKSLYALLYFEPFFKFHMCLNFQLQWKQERRWWGRRDTEEKRKG